MLWSRQKVLIAAALAAATLAYLCVLLVPTYSSGDFGSETLLEHEGVWVAAGALVPVALMFAAATTRVRSVRRASLAMLGIVCLLTGFSMGIFYLPAAMLLLLAAMLEKVRRDSSDDESDT